MNLNVILADVCGSKTGPLVNRNHEYLSCDECPSKSECIRYESDIAGFDVCCPTVDPYKAGICVHITTVSSDSLYLIILVVIIVLNI